MKENKEKPKRVRATLTQVRTLENEKKALAEENRSLRNKIKSLETLVDGYEHDSVSLSKYKDLQSYDCMLYDDNQRKFQKIEKLEAEIKRLKGRNLIQRIFNI